MRTTSLRIGALLAVVIGAMAIVAGGRVLLGAIPDYTVIDWLPLYNFIVGVISVAVTGVLIWRNHGHARPLALATLSAHVVVLGLLLTAYRGVVAPDSLVAMSIRITVWIVIVTLLTVHARKQASATLVS